MGQYYKIVNLDKKEYLKPLSLLKLMEYESTRNTLDLSAIPVIKARSHLPIIVDPSHASGHWHLVEPLSLAAAAVGADGLMIEVHNHPEQALSDGAQSLTPYNFTILMQKLERLLQALPSRGHDCD